MNKKVNVAVALKKSRLDVVMAPKGASPGVCVRVMQKYRQPGRSLEKRKTVFERLRNLKIVCCEI